MENYSIRCGSLDIPEDWKLLEDCDDSMRYAAVIHANEYQCIQLMKQYMDFKALYDSIVPKKFVNLHKRAFLSFQIQFQSVCLQEINKLREKAHMSKVLYPFVFVPEPSG